MDFEEQNTYSIKRRFDDRDAKREQWRNDVSDIKASLQQILQGMNSLTKSIQGLDSFKEEIRSQIAELVGRRSNSINGQHNLRGDALSVGADGEPTDVGLQMETNEIDDGEPTDVGLQMETNEIDDVELKIMGNINCSVIEDSGNLFEQKVFIPSGSKIRQVVVAQKVFVELPERVVAAGNAKTPSYAFRGLREEAFELFVKAPKEEAVTNIITWITIVGGLLWTSNVDGALELLFLTRAHDAPKHHLHSLIFRQRRYQYDPGITLSGSGNEGNHFVGGIPQNVGRDPEATFSIPNQRNIDTGKTQSDMLVITKVKIMLAGADLNALRELGNEEVEQCDPQIITQASSISQRPRESSSMDISLSIFSSHELPDDRMYEEISKVLKPGGTILIYKILMFDKRDVDKTIFAIVHKLMLEWFLKAQRLKLKLVAPTEVVSFGVKDLIDEDTLLTEKDLKKPQLPSVGDCEVGSTIKACNNCTCERAETEEKVEKLGVNMDQLNNNKLPGKISSGLAIFSTLSSWNPFDPKLMALPPCNLFAQFYVAKRSVNNSLGLILEDKDVLKEWDLSCRLKINVVVFNLILGF